MLHNLTLLHLFVPRMFGMKRCARCQAAILSSELVMRARDLVFHVHCFTCSACQTPLTKGDQFGMHGLHVFCQHHFEVTTPPSPSPGSTCPQIPPQSPFPYHQPPFPSPAGDYPSNLAPTMPPQPLPNNSPCSLEPKPFFNGAPVSSSSSSPVPTTPRQKGRPRKRKPKDLEGLTANLGECIHKLSYFVDKFYRMIYCLISENWGNWKKWHIFAMKKGRGICTNTSCIFIWLAPRTRPFFMTHHFMNSLDGHLNPWPNQSLLDVLLTCCEMLCPGFILQRYGNYKQSVE
jgi:hypothetical protein